VEVKKTEDSIIYALFPKGNVFCSVIDNSHGRHFLFRVQSIMRVWRCIAVGVLTRVVSGRFVGHRLSLIATMPRPLTVIPLRTPADRARQVILFEVFGLLLITPLFVLASGEEFFSSAGLLAVLSVIALFWNALYCDLFDRSERRLAHRAADQRPFRLRLLHAFGFEGGLVLITLPVILLWTDMGFWLALTADLGLALTYIGYAYVYNLAYDRIFPIR